MDTVIARSRSRMYTAFVAADGRRILNVALVVDGRQTCVSIEFGREEEAAIAAGDPGAVDRIVAVGRRLVTPLPTPSAGVPVTPVLPRAA